LYVWGMTTIIKSNKWNFTFLGGFSIKRYIDCVDHRKHTKTIKQ